MRASLRSGMIALALAALASPVAQAEVQVQSPPLAGAAYRIAEAAFAAYARGDYAQAERQAAEAVRLRPDVARLRLLQVYALQRLGRTEDARAAARAAVAAGSDDPALRAQAAAPVPALRNAARAPARRGAASAPATPAEAAYRRGFELATQAYADYNADRMPEAARKAEQAFRTVPAQGDWALLWIAALEAQQKLVEAGDAADAALALGAPNVADLQARRVALRRQRAVRPAQEGYQALIAERPADAVPFAREAIAYAPDVASHRLLLVTALMLDEQLPAAEQAAGEALARDDEDTVALVMRAYLRQRQHDRAGADADFDLALRQDWLDTEQQENVRLLAVDAALAVGDLPRATRLLQPLPADDEAVQRRRAALRDTRAPAELSLATYPPPAQLCRDTPYGTQCELAPADRLGSGGASTQAYIAFARKDYPEAIRQAQRAVDADPGNANLQKLLTTALAAGDARQSAQAEQRLDAALAAAPDDAPLRVQRAYLRLRDGRPGPALQDLQRARATGKAAPTILLDEAYAHAALGQNRTAVEQLRQALDEADAGTLKLSRQQRYDTRGSIANLSREWGAIVSVGYRGARQAASSLGGAAISTPGDAVVGTAEAFWRPAALNDRHGLLEVYGRLTNTLYDRGGSYESIRAVDPCTGESTEDARDRAERLQRAGSVAGWPSTIGALGVRYSVGRTGLTVGVERRQFLGTATRRGGIYPAALADQCRLQTLANQPEVGSLLARYRLGGNAGGWLSYLTYGFYHGTDLRLGTRHWFTVQGYGQAGYAWDDNAATFSVDRVDSDGQPTARLVDSRGRLKRDQWFAAAEVRAGQTFRVGGDDSRLLLNPYLVVGADWLRQSTRVTGVDYPQIGSQSFRLSDSGASWALGAGPGVSLRYWFREDRYHAPRSYLEGSLQYRFPLGGGDSQRAKGLFANLTFYY